MIKLFRKKQLYPMFPTTIRYQDDRIVILSVLACFFTLIVAFYNHQERRKTLDARRKYLLAQANYYNARAASAYQAQRSTQSDALTDDVVDVLKNAADEKDNIDQWY